MTNSFLVRAVAGVATTCIAVVGFATVASAAGTPATLNLGSVDTLTLPAGDGVRDTTTLHVTSDFATTVTVTIQPLGGGTALKTLAPTITTDGGSADVALSVQGLTADTFDIVATPALGDPVTTELMVGSGDPSMVFLSLSNTTMYTWSGATPHSTAAKVSAADETGLTVPFAGTVRAVAGGKVYSVPVTSTAGAPTAAYIPAYKLAAGTGSVTATVHAIHGTDNYASAPVTLKVLTTGVTSLAIKSAYATVYPAKDSYRDTTTLTVTPKATGPAFIPTGSVKITLNGKLVKSWPLTSTKVAKFAWDGKYAGSIVPGSYLVTATLKGPDGVTKTSTATVKVANGHLVSKTKTVNYVPSKVFTACFDYSWYGDGSCTAYTDGDVYLDSYGSDDEFSLIADGSLTIPSDIVSAQKYGTTKASATLHVYDGNGYAYLAYGPNSDAYSTGDYLGIGYNTLATVSIPSGSSRLYVGLGLEDYSDVSVDGLTIKYTYKALVS